MKSSRSLWQNTNTKDRLALFVVSNHRTYVMKVIQVPCWGNRNFRFDLTHTALVVIDMQRDFLAADGHVACKHGTAGQLAAIVPTAVSVLDAARQKKIRNRSYARRV